MSLFKKYLLLIIWAGILVFLLLISLVFKDQNTAIMAQVEPMKIAVSYHKAVRVLEIYALPGQQVSPGDLLVKVERPDLALDVERKKNDLKLLTIESNMLETSFKEKQKLLEVEYELKFEKLEARLEQLKVTELSNRKISGQFSAIAGYPEINTENEKSYLEIEIVALQTERRQTEKTYAYERGMNKSLYSERINSLKIKELQFLEELAALEEEQHQLIRRAHTHGTIGAVNAQPGELLPSYTTIMSIYEFNPTVIRAIMNEQHKHDVEIGQLVQVESVNRRYKIEGEISEVGSRIIEYPNRLNTNPNMAMWGRELFIKIPANNNFLNGERVIVSVKR